MKVLVMDLAFYTCDNKLNHQHISYIIQFQLIAIPTSLNQCCYSLTASACL